MDCRTKFACQFLCVKVVSSLSNLTRSLEKSQFSVQAHVQDSEFHFSVKSNLCVKSDVQVSESKFLFSDVVCLNISFRYFFVFLYWFDYLSLQRSRVRISVPSKQWSLWWIQLLFIRDIFQGISNTFINQHVFISMSFYFPFIYFHPHVLCGQVRKLEYEAGE